MLLFLGANRLVDASRRSTFDLGGIGRAIGLVSDHQDDDEDEHRGHDDATDDDDHGATQELRLSKLALSGLRRGTKVDTAHHTCGSEGRDAIIVHGKDTQLVFTSCRQVVDPECLALGGNHPRVMEKDRQKK